ncbi:hypothetical protein DQX05_25185 [Paenibacillus thiaminolyticus]|uniref:Uncharacterized protein n=1 Tax=Paenibacillus thiaminolyticus TaxID=49283 RepID=A0A3A3GD57_PANTH|nr:hypothetical protein DQX05_25185 [Paenibacillus thiaminolyticus]
MTKKQTVRSRVGRPASLCAWSDAVQPAALREDARRSGGRNRGSRSCLAMKIAMKIAMKMKEEKQ